MYKMVIIYLLCCSVFKSCLTLSDPMDCSMTGLLVPHLLPEFAQLSIYNYTIYFNLENVLKTKDAN